MTANGHYIQIVRNVTLEHLLLTLWKLKVRDTLELIRLLVIKQLK